MLSLISFIAVIIGAINWFCIGLLQFDFVAGLFGSQSSIFSRIVYIAVGLGALVLLFNLIENKGKIKFNFAKKEKNNEKIVQKTFYSEPRYTYSVEAGEDYDKEKTQSQKTKNNNIYISGQEDNQQQSCNNGYCEIKHDKPSINMNEKKN